MKHYTRRIATAYETFALSTVGLGKIHPNSAVVEWCRQAPRHSRHGRARPVLPVPCALSDLHRNGGPRGLRDLGGLGGFGASHWPLGDGVFLLLFLLLVLVAGMKLLNKKHAFLGKCVSEYLNVFRENDRLISRPQLFRTKFHVDVDVSTSPNTTFEDNAEHNAERRLWGMGMGDFSWWMQQRREKQSFWWFMVQISLWKCFQTLWLFWYWMVHCSLKWMQWNKPLARKEGAKINASLAALKECIRAIWLQILSIRISSLILVSSLNKTCWTELFFVVASVIFAYVQPCTLLRSTYVFVTMPYFWCLSDRLNQQTPSPQQGPCFAQQVHRLPAEPFDAVAAGLLSARWRAGRCC